MMITVIVKKMAQMSQLQELVKRGNFTALKTVQGRFYSMLVVKSRVLKYLVDFDACQILMKIQKV